MNINWTQVHDFLDVLVLVFGAIAMGLLIYMRGIFASKAAIADIVDKFDKALGALDKRVNDLERRTDGKAAKDEIRRLDVEHGRLNGVFERVDRSVSALERAVERIEDVMLREQGR